MTTILIVVVGLAIVAGAVGLMMWVDRVHRRRIQRRREAWKAAGARAPAQPTTSADPELFSFPRRLTQAPNSSLYHPWREGT